METMKNLITMTLAIGTLCFAQLSNAQKLSAQSSNIKIDGTSTLHAWDMTSKQSVFSGTLAGSNITNVRFVMKATSLKSNESGLDKNAYKALNTEKYPDIVFTASSIPTSGTATISGNLTITNATKEVKIPVTVTKNGDSYNIKGSTKIKMTTFGVTPPKLMMGTIKTGDDLTITINITATN
jgi:polyisoprenoid-binding protein YceI